MDVVADEAVDLEKVPVEMTFQDFSKIYRKIHPH